MLKENFLQLMEKHNYIIFTDDIDDEFERKVLKYLYEKSSDYASENFLNIEIGSDDYFVEDRYHIKIDNIFIEVNLVCGQGSYNSFIKIESSDKYVDFELMEENRNPDNYDQLRFEFYKLEIEESMNRIGIDIDELKSIVGKM